MIKSILLKQHETEPSPVTPSGQIHISSSPYDGNSNWIGFSAVISAPYTDIEPSNRLRVSYERKELFATLKRLRGVKNL